jgi:hypothetical protein
MSNFNTFNPDSVSADRLKRPGRELVAATARTLATMTDMATRSLLDAIPEPQMVTYEPPVYAPQENPSPSAEGLAHMVGGEAEEAAMEARARDGIDDMSEVTETRATQLAAAQSSVTQALQGVDNVQIP